MRQPDDRRPSEGRGWPRRGPRAALERTEGRSSRTRACSRQRRRARQREALASPRSPLNTLSGPSQWTGPPDKASGGPVAQREGPAACSRRRGAYAVTSVHMPADPAAALTLRLHRWVRGPPVPWGTHVLPPNVTPRCHRQDDDDEGVTEQVLRGPVQRPGHCVRQNHDAEPEQLPCGFEHQDGKQPTG